MLLPLLALLACDSSPAPVSTADDTAATTDATGNGETDGGADGTDSATASPGDVSCETTTSAATLSDYACSGGETGCADEGPFIDGTCCAEGSGLVEIGEAIGSEVVDLEVDGGLTAACGGFGVRVSDVSDPEHPAYLGSASDRCQRLDFGPTLDDGTRVLTVTHHGDTWVLTPHLTTLHISPEGNLSTIDRLEDPELLFEGVRWHGDRLYVAVHDQGLRVYRADNRGVPTLERTISGFTNAARLDIDGDRLYVTDEDRVHVFDVSDPGDPDRLSEAPTSAIPRDIDVADGRAFVALGSGGFEAFDVTAAGLENPTRVITEGSVQAVAAEADVVALAAWNHVQVRRADTLALLTTRKSRPYDEYEQDFGVALEGGDLYVGEWEGVHILRYREGYVGADIWLTDDVLNFWGDEPWSHILYVSNRGALPLCVSDIAASDPAVFAAEPSVFTVEPGLTERVSLTYTPPADGGTHSLSLHTNDPDAEQSPLVLPIYTADGGGTLGVGDRLGDEFAFLDPSGARDRAALDDHVVILAYFALF